MIHEALTKSIVAKRYYKITKPEKTYNNEQARKQFDQDKYINKPVLRDVIKAIYKEQLELISKG